MKTIIAITLIALSAPLHADQWDDMQRRVEQERARQQADYERERARREENRRRDEEREQDERIRRLEKEDGE